MSFFFACSIFHAPPAHYCKQKEGGLLKADGRRKRNAKTTVSEDLLGRAPVSRMEHVPSQQLAQHEHVALRSHSSDRQTLAMMMASGGEAIMMLMLIWIAAMVTRYTHIPQMSMLPLGVG